MHAGARLPLCCVTTRCSRGGERNSSRRCLRCLSLLDAAAVIRLAWEYSSWIWRRERAFSELWSPRPTLIGTFPGVFPLPLPLVAVAVVVVVFPLLRRRRAAAAACAACDSTAVTSSIGGGEPALPRLAALAASSAPPSRSSSSSPSSSV